MFKCSALLQCFLIIIVTRVQAYESHRIKPNIVLIYADDLGYGDLSSYGAVKVQTPNIDALAAEGTAFMDAHSPSAVCTPSRYGLLTGEYPLRKNMYDPIFLKDPLVIDTDKATIQSILGQNGYQSALIGKWHLGFGTKKPTDWNAPLTPGPLETGFDYFYGVPVVNSHPPFVYVENHHVVGYDPDDPFIYSQKSITKPYPEKLSLGAIGGADSAHSLYIDEEVATHLTGKAVQWINDNKDSPFFLYFATTNIHHPFTPHPRFQGTSEAGLYGDFIHELDWAVGEVLKALEENGLKENTLVIFTSDNGGMLNGGGHEAWAQGHAINGDLLGFKFGVFEGGHRVPFIARWPGYIADGNESEKLISSIDLLGTFAAIVGHKLAPGEGIDSYNMLPALTGDNTESVRDELIYMPRRPSHVSLRKDNWVYIPAQGGGGFSVSEWFLTTEQVNSDIDPLTGKTYVNAPPAQLYDVEIDPNQTQNLYTENPVKVSVMKEELKTLLTAEQTRPDVPVIAGCPDSNYEEFKPFRNMDDTSLCESVARISEGTQNPQWFMVKSKKDELIITLTSAKENVTIAIFSLYGRRHNYKMMATPGKIAISKKDFKPGVYIIQLRFKGKLKGTEKFVI